MDPLNPEPQPAARKKRGPKGPIATSWKPGQSGNPAGTSKTPPEVRAYLAEKSMSAAKALVAIVESADKHETKDVVAASRVLLDFSVSKPKETEDVHEKAGEVIAALAALLTQPKG